MGQPWNFGISKIKFLNFFKNATQKKMVSEMETSEFLKLLAALLRLCGLNDIQKEGLEAK